MGWMSRNKERGERGREHRWRCELLSRVKKEEKEERGARSQSECSRIKGSSGVVVFVCDEGSGRRRGKR